MSEAPSPVSEFSRCQICNEMRATATVSFYRNIGMLVARRQVSMTRNLCKTCMGRKFWEFQGKNLLLGPWGFFSLLLTPVLLVTNTVAYVTALHKIRGAVE